MSLAEQSLQWYPTSVQVTVLQARGLRIKGKNGTNDAYAIMQVAKEKFSTSVAEKCVAPVWKEEATFDLPLFHSNNAERCTLQVFVMHRAVMGPDKTLGQANINLLDLNDNKSRDKTEWFKLVSKTGKADKNRGEVLLDIQFMKNNMTASMFDLSGPDKSRSKFGKLKDKLKGKKKDGMSDSASAIVPSVSQILTDSEEEQETDVTPGAKKKNKLKSLFVPKSGLHRNMSQSMSTLATLPEKDSAISLSRSSGLNVESPEGKKKFKFLKHKRTGSSDSKVSQGASSLGQGTLQNSVCINGSHVYAEEPETKVSRASSPFSLNSSGHGSMEDLRRGHSRKTSNTSVDSLKASDLQTQENAAEEMHRKQEEQRKQEEEVRKRLEEVKRRQAEEEKREQLRREAVRMEEERKRIEREEERKRIEKEEERKLVEREEGKRKKEEDERKRIEREEERKRKEKEEERKQVEREMEERQRVEEEERERIEKEEMVRIKKEQERVRQEEERKQAEEERIRVEARMREMEKRKKMEEEEKARLEEDKRRRMEEEERKRIEREEERKRIEKEEERKLVEREEGKRKKEEDERKSIEREEERKRKEKEEERKRVEREMEERQRAEEEERERIKKEEMVRIKKEQERVRQEEERKQAEEERIREMEKRKKMEEEEKARLEEDKRRRMEEEERARLEKERLRKEEETRRVETQRRHTEEEERLRKEKEKKEAEEMQKRKVEEEKRKTEEKERLSLKERLDKERLELEKKKMEERMQEEQERKRAEEEEKRKLKEKETAQERIRQEEEEKEKQRKMKEQTYTTEKKPEVKPRSARLNTVKKAEKEYVPSANPFEEALAFDENSPNPFEVPQPEALSCPAKVSAVKPRPHAVKPLSTTERPPYLIETQDNSRSTKIIDGMQAKMKAPEAKGTGRYSQLTHEELVNLLEKQKEQLSQKDSKIVELEQYIDNLLVRVMEEKPSILMSLSSLKKSV
ncbi:rab11 family-interacting protein 1-like isoform X2 [Myxocyprinus asiaticus]|uniref:rab11 family-interacting protein 1-like isoform X2 n=1 Tax=Myxocyprinus asiaticus TaxID=70543 RepID=UPI0022226A38|nr:rab11 family-interacting protein 1-like isoform X2 [Myxocyprinus asiaticus]